MTARLHAAPHRRVPPLGPAHAARSPVARGTWPAPIRACPSQAHPGSVLVIAPAAWVPVIAHAALVPVTAPAALVPVIAPAAWVLAIAPAAWVPVTAPAFSRSAPARDLVAWPLAPVTGRAGLTWASRAFRATWAPDPDRLLGRSAAWGGEEWLFAKEKRGGGGSILGQWRRHAWYEHKVAS